MKKLLTLLIVITVFASCNQKATYTINGNISGIDGQVYLIHIVDNKPVKEDSATLVEEKFTFKGSVENPEMYMITFKKHPRARIQFIIDNSVINIKADIKNPKEQPVITGSAPQDVLIDYQDAMKPFHEREMQMRKEYGEAQAAKDQAKVDEIIKNYEEMQDEIKTATYNFIRSNNKSYAAALIAAQQRLESANDIDNLVAMLDESLQNLDMIVKMKEQADNLRKVEIGQVAPDFTLNDTEGNPVTLSSLFGNGYILIDFWASWCSPCRAENPNVVATYKEFHDKGFDIIGVSLDRTQEDAWKKAIKDDGLTWTQVLDWTDGKATAATNYAVTGIPMNFLLDKNGKIVAKNLRGEALKEKLAELLK